MSLAQQVFLPGKPLQGLDGLIGWRPMTSMSRLRGNLAFGDQFLTPESVASGDDGQTLLHGIKIFVLFESVPELLTTSSSTLRPWSVLSFPIPTRVWFQYYREMEGFLRNHDDDDHILYIHGAVFVPFNTALHDHLRVTV